MAESLLFVSYINLLSLLPLFAAFRLAENLRGLRERSLWEAIVSEPWLLCLAVVAGSTLLALKLWKASFPEESSRGFLYANTAVMLLVWVAPGLFQAPDWLQAALLQSWTIGVCILLLLACLPLPFRTIQRMLRDTRK